MEDGTNVHSIGCSVDGCRKGASTLGWCHMHYWRHRTYGDVNFKRVFPSHCTIEACNRKHAGRGFCGAHLRKYHLYGDPFYERPKVLGCKTPACERRYHASGYCQKCYFRQYDKERRKNPEYRMRCVKYIQRYMEKNKDKRRAYDLARARRVEVKERRRQLDQRPEVKLRKANYQKSLRGKMASAKTRHNRRQAYGESDVTTSFLEHLWTVTRKCELCKSKLGEDRHLDHIIPIAAGGAHIQANVRYICPTCNVRRPRDGRDIVQPHLFA